MKKIIIDTDPGIDDAIAIALAIRSKELDIKLISTVCGNVNVDKTTNNALKLVEFFNTDIPVAKGCKFPILKTFEDASEYHGESGMSGYDFKEPTKKELEIHAIEALYKTIMQSNEKITLVTIGPLTNIAILFMVYPEVKKNIDEIVMMGGSLCGGNMNTVAEFNVYVDPHAAAIVFKSGVKINMIGLDVTMNAIVNEENILKIKQLSKFGDMFYGMFKHCLKTGIRIHDACTIAFMLKQELFETKEYFIDVVTDGPAAGALITDLYHDYSITNVNVCTKLNYHLFEEWIVNELIK